MPPLALVPFNEINPLFPNKPLQIRISQPSFHPQQGQVGAPKGFQSEGNHNFQQQLSNYSFAPAEPWVHLSCCSN